MGDRGAPLTAAARAWREVPLRGQRWLADVLDGALEGCDGDELQALEAAMSLLRAASAPGRCHDAVYCEAARVAFDSDVYDCARCGHMNGDHCGPRGECVRCAMLARGEDGGE